MVNASSVPMFTRSASLSIGSSAGNKAAKIPNTIVVIHGVRNFGCTADAHFQKQAVLRHRVEDARLPQQHHQHHRGQPEHRADLHQQRAPAYARRVDAQRYRSAHVQGLVTHQAASTPAIPECIEWCRWPANRECRWAYPAAASWPPARPSTPRRIQCRRRKCATRPWKCRPIRSCRSRPWAE